MLPAVATLLAALLFEVLLLLDVLDASDPRLKLRWRLSISILALSARDLRTVFTRFHVLLSS